MALKYSRSPTLQKVLYSRVLRLFCIVFSTKGYDMSPFIRRYAKYLNEKALSYRTVAFDFCKMKRGKEEGSLRVMHADKLLKTLPILQAQLDSLLEFDCTANDLTNGKQHARLGNRPAFPSRLVFKLHLLILGFWSLCNIVAAR